MPDDDDASETETASPEKQNAIGDAIASEALMVTESEPEPEAETEADVDSEEEVITDMHHHALNAAASRMHHSANDGPFKETHKTLEALSDSLQKLHEYEEQTLVSLPLGIQADACAILAAFNITAARRVSHGLQLQSLWVTYSYS